MANEFVPFFGCMISAKYPHFEAAVRKTLPPLGIKLIDVEGFSCCPDPIYFKSSDKMTWLTLAARNLSLAEETGLDIMTCCSGCTGSLAEAYYLLNTEPELKERVNERLKKIGREYRGISKVRHIVTILRDDVGIEKVEKSVTEPLYGLRIAIHYGCHLLKPSRIMQVDDPDRPTIMERLFKAIGATPFNHEEKILCCGKACMNASMPPKMLHEVFVSVLKLNVDCLGLICPTCYDEYDGGQVKVAKLFDMKFRIPVFYYFQLLAVAQGYDPEEVGILKFGRMKQFIEVLEACKKGLRTTV